jgi:hypothetical protein
MLVEFDRDDLTVLQDAVRVQRDTLLGELAHTDHRSAREMLRERLDRMERLLSKLGEVQDQPPFSVH